MHVITKYIAIGLTTISLGSPTPSFNNGVRNSIIQQEMDNQLAIYQANMERVRKEEEEKRIIEEEQKRLEEERLRIEQERIQWEDWEITFYCSCSLCSGEWGTSTASGQPLVPYVTCASDKSIPFGTKIHIEGWGDLTVVDRGGAVRGNVLDVYVSSHEEALRLGRKFMRGYIIK